MKIAIAGGTGFVGQQLTNHLVNQGHTICVLTRSPERYTNSKDIHYIEWLNSGSHPEKHLTKLDAVVNLAGDSLFGYWTTAKKERILQSRIQATDQVMKILKNLDHKPEVFINASAIGYYGTSETVSFTEETTTPGDDFLAHVTTQWEKRAKQAEQLGIRTVFARFGIILGKSGSLPLMTLPFTFMLGGKVGSGDQWMSWIHINDTVRLIESSLHHKELSGPLNVTSPSPVTNRTFSKTLAHVLRRPYWLPAPSFAIQTLLGEMSMLVLKGQSVLPKKAQSLGFNFHYPQLNHALQNIYSRNQS